MESKGFHRGWTQGLRQASCSSSFCRVSWSWPSDRDSSRDFAKLRQFADLIPIRPDQPLEIHMSPRGGFAGQIRLPAAP